MHCNLRRLGQHSARFRNYRSATKGEGNHVAIEEVATAELSVWVT